MIINKKLRRHNCLFTVDANDLTITSKYISPRIHQKFLAIEHIQPKDNNDWSFNKKIIKDEPACNFAQLERNRR